MSEQVKTAGESLGQDIVSEDAESAVGEVAANQGVETAGNAEAVAAGVDEEPEGEAADEPTEEELAAARELAENNALADVFDDVRKQSADSHLVTPERWPEIGLVPEHMTAEDFEMFVYEWLEDYQAEHKEEIEAERAAERAKAAAVRSATRAVGVPPKIPNRRLEQIEADNEARRPRLPIRRRKPLRIPLKPNPPRASMLPHKSITLRKPPKAPPSPQRLRFPSLPRVPLMTQPKTTSPPRTTGAPSPVCAFPRATALSRSRANGCSWRTRTPRPCARRSSATASRCSWACTATISTTRRS